MNYDILIEDSIRSQEWFAFYDGIIRAMEYRDI